ncbi:DUF4261 domain-containing protein [Gilliamella sp. Pas-s27]|uniref:DUF4261 domain-containing protein n=1 Tax=Gilliamella sp. Pas-s27 TaxID=2687311 RepID=UPI0013662E61|nr:DUF4261 domain-containing protein [Gilliamella sp. Pas-s27]MWP46948.1 DUF4261 domain-containing protein [Gilliamella sp. Pas-s27]
MSLFSRLFGKKSQPQSQFCQADDVLIENTNIKEALSLSIVFKGSLNFNESDLLDSLRKLNPTLKNAQYQTPFGQLDEGSYALVGWGKHVVKLFGINAPYPVDILEECVTPAHYSQELKEQIRHNDSHLLLYYVGYDQDVLEQYLALTYVAACFEPFNALAVINPNGHTSLPVNVIHKLIADKDGINSLCYCLPTFFCGFVKYDVENVKGVWMRTYGASVFCLPDFAVLANTHDEGEYYFDMFGNILQYLRDSGATMVPGDTMEVGDNKIMSLRAPKGDEYFLKDTGHVLVVEINNNSI